MMHTAMLLTMGPPLHGSSSSHLHHPNAGFATYEITPPPPPLSTPQDSFLSASHFVSTARVDDEAYLASWGAPARAVHVLGQPIHAIHNIDRVNVDKNFDNHSLLLEKKSERSVVEKKLADTEKQSLHVDRYHLQLQNRDSMTSPTVIRQTLVPANHGLDNCFFQCLEKGDGDREDVVECRHQRRDGDDDDNGAVSSQPRHLQHPTRRLVLDKLVDLWRVFSKYADDCLLREGKIRSALLELDIFPAQAQIQEMLYVAGKRSPAPSPIESPTKQTKQTSPARSYLTYGEFCFFATDLKEKYEKQPYPPTLCAKQRRNIENGRQLRKFSSLVSNFQVFLGGACNPTSWRQDVAIPILSQHSISFYNPQRPDWDPQMIEIEDQAKQVADVLFFVVDNKTRSTSSMVEAAYLTGCDCSVFLVVKSYEGPGVEVQGERMSDSEYYDLKKAQLYLTDIVERHGLPVFSDIATAIRCAVKLLQTKDMRVQDLTLEDGAEPVRYGHIKLGDRFVGAGQVFQSYDPQRTGCIAAKDVCVAFKSITKEDLDDAALAKFKQPANSPSQNYSSTVGNNHQNHHHHHHTCSIKRRASPHFNFDEFCCVLTNFKNSPINLNNNNSCGSCGSNNNNFIQTTGGDVVNHLNQNVPREFHVDNVETLTSKSAPSSPQVSHARKGTHHSDQRSRWWRLRRFLLCKFSTWFLPSVTAPAAHHLQHHQRGVVSSNPAPNFSSTPSPSTTPNQRHRNLINRPHKSSIGTCNIPQSSSMTLSSSPSSVSLSPSFAPPSAIGSLPSSDLGSPVTSQPCPTAQEIDASSGVPSQTVTTPGSFSSSASSSGISSAHSPSFSSSLSSASNGILLTSASTSPHYSHGPPPPPPPSTPSIAPRSHSSSSSRKYDIFLGGSIRDSSWRENIAIPELKKKGISYYHPKKTVGVVGGFADSAIDVSSASSPSTSGGESSSYTSSYSDVAVVSGRYLPMEATYRENSSLLLYVIDSTSRGLASMLEAAVYIGQGCRMVLCIREIPQGAVIMQDKLSNNAIRDYNRSRKYLSDIATREGVPVFDDISEAVVAAIEILEKQKQTSVNLTP